MNSTPKLNFPAINLRAKRDKERTLVFDEVRSMYVVLTPEDRKTFLFDINRQDGFISGKVLLYGYLCTLY